MVFLCKCAFCRGDQNEILLFLVLLEQNNTYVFCTYCVLYVYLYAMQKMQCFCWCNFHAIFSLHCRWSHRAHLCIPQTWGNRFFQHIWREWWSWVLYTFMTKLQQQHKKKKVWDMHWKIISISKMDLRDTQRVWLHVQYDYMSHGSEFNKVNVLTPRHWSH